MVVAIPGLVLLTVLLVAVTFHGLINGAPWLTEPLLGLVPLGNLAVALSLTSIATCNLICLAKSPFNQLVAKVGLIAALLWYPVGIIWSGNLRLQFLNNGDLWMPFSYGVAVVCVVPVLINLILRWLLQPLLPLIRRWFKTGT